MGVQRYGIFLTKQVISLLLPIIGPKIYYHIYPLTKTLVILSMAVEKIINHPIIGEYRIIKKVSSRGIRLLVSGSKGVHLTIPAYASYRQASEFLESKLDWVIKSLEKQKEKAKKHSLLLNNGTSIVLINCIITLSQINPSQINNPENTNNKITIRTNRVENGEAITRHISYPANASTENLALAVNLAIKRSAKEYLPERALFLANKHGFKYKKLFLKNNKTNWGSCSSLNNINLNIHLMRLPVELCDYVILHELAHLKHKNHGKEFHTYLNSLCDGREKEFSNRLKQFRPSI